jgi:hypothetical protein
VANPQIIVEYTADTGGLQKGFAGAEKSSKGLGSSLKGVGKVGALAAGAAGVGALVATLKIGIGEFSETQKVAAQTNAVLKSTGGVANVTASDVDTLAGALMKKSGVDDEAIASGENMLLTFTNIHNEVGKGNDIFNQATAAALDMSVALGTDMTTASQQLGKALNDPVKGMTKLQKSGVTFTDAQKEMVKAMVASGDTMGAQKIILKELNTEFGGSAEALGNTLPGQINIVKESFNNLAGELVAKLVPALTTAMGWLKDHWPEIQAAIQAFADAVLPIFTGIADLVGAVVGVIRDHWGTIGPILRNVANAFKAAFDIIAGIIALLVALIHGDWAGAWKALKDIVDAAVRLVVSLVKAQLGILIAYVTTVWDGIKAVSRAAWEAIKSLIGGIVAAIRADLVDTWNDIKSVVSTVANAIKTALVNAFNAIKGAGEAVSGFFQGAWTAALDAIKGAFKTAKAAAQTVVDFLTGALTSAFDTAKGAVDGLEGVVSAVAGAFDTAAGAVQRLIDAIHSIPSHIPMPSIPHLPSIPGLNMAAPAMVGPSLLATQQTAAAPTASRLSSGALQVRVFIGDTELKGIVRSEVRDAGNGLARTILAGAR